MPRLPRISSKQAIKALESLGFEKVRPHYHHIKKKSDRLRKAIAGYY